MKSIAKLMKEAAPQPRARFRAWLARCRIAAETRCYSSICHRWSFIVHMLNKVIPSTSFDKPVGGDRGQVPAIILTLEFRLGAPPWSAWPNQALRRGEAAATSGICGTFSLYLPQTQQSDILTRIWFERVFEQESNVNYSAYAAKKLYFSLENREACIFGCVAYYFKGTIS